MTDDETAQAVVEGRIRGTRASIIIADDIETPSQPTKEEPRRRSHRDEWGGFHYDSQGYCDNPGRGY